MAEIFVASVDSTVADMYVSDLPVINEAPVSRQIGWYLSSLLAVPVDSLPTISTGKSFVTNLDTYMAGATFKENGGVAKDMNLWALYNAAGTAISSSNGTLLVSAGEYRSGTVSVQELLSRIVIALALECRDGTVTAITKLSVEAEFDAVAASKDIRLIAVPATVDAIHGTPDSNIQAGSSDVSTEGLMRILSGATPSGAGEFTTSAPQGNHRLVGGRRRIYTRDRVDGSMNEGFLANFKSTSWSSDGAAIVIFDKDGSVQ